MIYREKFGVINYMDRHDIFSWVMCLREGRRGWDYRQWRTPLFGKHERENVAGKFQVHKRFNLLLFCGGVGGGGVSSVLSWMGGVCT